LKKPVPNWKLIDCPKCGKLKGQDCYVKHLNLFCCPERARAAGIGRKNLALPRADFRLGCDPASKCKKKKHATCPGHHPRNHGLPGLLCTCNCHRQSKKTDSQPGWLA